VKTDLSPPHRGLKRPEDQDQKDSTKQAVGRRRFQSSRYEDSTALREAK
jgi:hypothetical protein